METIINEFNNKLGESFGFSLRPYQEYVIKDIVSSMESGGRFIVVSMPTGSGKTLIEIFAAYYNLKNTNSRILVVEPTRFLCDQAYSKLWSKLFNDIVGKEYEGNESSFLDEEKRIVISTPKTALKWISTMREKFDIVIIDEIHHAFGGKYYQELLTNLNPNYVFGFTALLPSKKKCSLDLKVQSILGRPTILNYDFKKLSGIDSSFQPPKAIADLFDAEMDEIEESAYDKLFCATVLGDPRTVQFLENTLARYGKRAFCESLKRAIVKNKISDDLEFAKFCNSNEPSHKARVLSEILTIYDAKNNDELKPIIVFTSRKATAYEFKEVIINSMGLSPNKVEVLTSDMSKDERLALMNRIKEGFVDVIISTLVGEEGVDIPEAGLLIMSDTPKSPLRFYQRLGRLIRLASPMKVKYLVIPLTPKTREYGDLEEALWNLYGEGVDVSYILYNLEEKGVKSRIVDILNKFSDIYNDVAIPYTLITQGREVSKPLDYILNIVKNDKKFLETLKSKGINIDSEEELSNIFFIIATYPFWLRCHDDVKNTLHQIDKIMNKGSFNKVLDKSMKEYHVFYIYDVEKLSDLMTEELKRLYHVCKSEGESYRENIFFRLDKKSILKLFMKIYSFKQQVIIEEKLKNQVDSFEGHFKNVKISIKNSHYNQRIKSSHPKLVISVGIDNVHIHLEAQINYYNINNENKEAYKKILELMRLNLLAIGYKAVEKFLEEIEES